MKFSHVIYDRCRGEGKALGHTIIILLVYCRDIKGLECQHLLVVLGHHWAIMLHPWDGVCSSALLSTHHKKQTVWHGVGTM